MSHAPAERFATCCSDAMFGYAEAAQAMWWAATLESIEMCGRVVKSVSEPDAETAPKSWFNPKSSSKPNYGTQSFAGFAPQPVLPWFAGAGITLPSFGLWSSAMSPAVSPFDVWFDMMPLRGGPAAWPMAFFMLSAGVPKAVAWPTAEANAAMMEAAEVATGQLQSVFASYRTETGYATAGFGDGGITGRNPMMQAMAMAWAANA